MNRVQKPAVFLAAIVCALGFAPRSVLAGPPRERDVWYSNVSRDQQQFGYEHVSVRRQDDGTFCYQVETRMLMDVLGQRQEETEKARYVVTPTYEPVSVESEGKTLSGPSHLKGRVEGGKLVLEYQRSGVQRKAAIDLSTKAMFRVCVEDWLQGQPAGAARATCRFINEASLELDTATATREKGDTATWTIDFGPETGQPRVSFDAQGIRREADYRLHGVRVVRAEEAAACKIQHRKFQGREILMFPVDKPLGAPDRLTSLTARLTWQDIPFDKFHLEDGRQQIASRVEKDGRYEAVVRVRRPTVAPSDFRFPAKGDEFRPWLAETRFIKPKDPDIARQARAWIGDEKTALGAVRALSSAVFKHMQGGTLIAETLSGPEVLKSRQGKCSEHAILFASTARSVGIPTRIVLGMRLVFGAWVGHMWNEAYVGRWVTVDATADEVGGGPTLIKLVHSDSVFGTAPIRFGLTTSLDVKVEAFEPPVPTVAGAYKTGVEGPVYTNVDYACRFTAPDKTWTPKEEATKQTGLSALGFKPPPVIRFQIPDHDKVLIHLVCLSLPSAVTPSMLVEARASKFKSLYKGYEVLKNEDYPLQRMPGRIFVFRRDAMKKETSPMKTTEVLWNDGTSCFLLNLIADEKSHDEYAAQFFKLLNSCEKLPTTPAKPETQKKNLQEK